MINLVQNAIKFSKRGQKIKVQTSLVNTENPLRTVGIKVKVQDQGIGISELDKDKLFSPYFRTTDATSRNSNKDGNGLGLYISKKIMEGLGGTLDFNSKVDVGSVFLLSFEAQKIRGNPNVSLFYAKVSDETRGQIYVRQVNKSKKEGKRKNGRDSRSQSRVYQRK